MEKKELVKPEENREDILKLYGYSENSTNDAPNCDANGSTENCAC